MKWLKSVFLSLFSLLLLLLVLELFLQTTHCFGARISWSLPDPILGWRFVPSRTFWVQEENPKPVQWETNRFGWKDTEWAFEKKPATFRIAVLGDSYAESLHVQTEDNFLSRAQQLLPGTEWMNFGRSGFTQSEEWLVLKNEVARFKPDAVILFFFALNDITDIDRSTTLDSIRPFFYETASGDLQPDFSFNQTREYQLKKWFSPLKNHSALFSLFSQRMTLLKLQRNFSKLPPGNSSQKLRGYLSLATSTPEAQYVKNYSLNKKLILEMAAFCKTRGIRFLLVNLDLPTYLPEIQKGYRRQDASFDADFFNKDLGLLAQSHQFEYLDLNNVFSENYARNKTPLHFQYYSAKNPALLEWAAHTGHWNEIGNQIVAQSLAQRAAAWIAEKAVNH